MSNGDVPPVRTVRTFYCNTENRASQCRRQKLLFDSDWSTFMQRVYTVFSVKPPGVLLDTDGAECRGWNLCEPTEPLILVAPQILRHPLLLQEAINMKLSPQTVVKHARQVEGEVAQKPILHLELLKGMKNLSLRRDDNPGLSEA